MALVVSLSNHEGPIPGAGFRRRPRFFHCHGLVAVGIHERQL